MACILRARRRRCGLGHRQPPRSAPGRRRGPASLGPSPASGPGLPAWLQERVPLGAPRSHGNAPLPAALGAPRPRACRSAARPAPERRGQPGGPALPGRAHWVGRWALRRTYVGRFFGGKSRVGVRRGGGCRRGRDRGRSGAGPSLRPVICSRRRRRLRPGPRPPERRRARAAAHPRDRAVWAADPPSEPCSRPRRPGTGLPQSQRGRRPQRRAGWRDGVGRAAGGWPTPLAGIRVPWTSCGDQRLQLYPHLPAGGTEAPRPDSPSPSGRPARDSALHCTLGSTKVSLIPRWGCIVGQSQVPPPPP